MKKVPVQLDFDSRPEHVAASLVSETTSDAEYRAVDRRLRRVYTALARQVREARDAGDRELRHESERRRCFVSDVMEEAQNIILSAQDDRLRAREAQDGEAAAAAAAPAQEKSAAADGAAQLSPQREKIRQDALVLSADLKKALLLKAAPRDETIGFFIGVHIAHLNAHRIAIDKGLRAAIDQINKLTKEVRELRKK